MTHATIQGIDIEVFGATDRTRWCFVTVRSDRRQAGFGEATLQKHEPELLAAAAGILPGLVGRKADPALVAGRSLPSLVEATVHSALSQALWDLAAKAEGCSVSVLLGGRDDTRVPVYANINRRTTDRSPEGFVRSAQAALAAGHRALKIAPFDEVVPGQRSQKATCIDNGLARIHAVRQAIGPDIDLMVDCHWRLDPSLAHVVIDRLRDVGLYWLECPVPETADMLPVLKDLRRRAHAAGMRLAGAELGFGVDYFEPFIAVGAYDVLMPDIKHVGSLDEMLRLAERLEGTGVALSPHNPSGPVSHAASLHVSGCLGGETRLEMQFDETPLFQRLCPAVPVPGRGLSALPPGPGLGADPDRDLLESHRISRHRHD